MTEISTSAAVRSPFHLPEPRAEAGQSASSARGLSPEEHRDLLSKTRLLENRLRQAGHGKKRLSVEEKRKILHEQVRVVMDRAIDLYRNPQARQLINEIKR